MNYKNLLSYKNEISNDVLKFHLKQSIESNNLENCIYYSHKWLLLPSIKNNWENLRKYIIYIYYNSIEYSSDNTTNLLNIKKILTSIEFDSIHFRRDLVLLLHYICIGNKCNDIDIFTVVYNTTKLNKNTIDKYSNIYDRIEILPECANGLWGDFLLRDDSDLPGLMDGFIYHLNTNSNVVFYYMYGILSLKYARKKCGLRLRGWKPAHFKQSKRFGGRFLPEYAIWEYLLNSTPIVSPIYEILEFFFYTYSCIDCNIIYLISAILYILNTRNTDIVNTDTVNTDIVNTDIVNTDTVNTDIVNTDIVNTDIVNTFSKEIKDFINNDDIHYIKPKPNIMNALKTSININSRYLNDYLEIYKQYNIICKSKLKYKYNTRKKNNNLINNNNENDTTIELTEDPIPNIIC